MKRRATPKRFANRRDYEYLSWIRKQPCVVAGEDCWGTTEAAHLTTRGAGGYDRSNTVPLCKAHHARQHQMGIFSFDQEHHVNLRETARRLDQEYEHGAPFVE